MALISSRRAYFSLAKIQKMTRLKSSVIDNVFENPAKNYRHYKLKKQTGGVRIISIPDPTLSRIQKVIALELNDVVRFHDGVHGFVRGNSIITNAKSHVGNKNFLQTDISDFFGSCDSAKLTSSLRGVIRGPETNGIIQRFCLLDSRLPQGAPSSPVLSNICASGLDQAIARYSSQNALVYTRYADDLNLSGKEIAVTALKEVKSILEKHEFLQNAKKTRLINSGQKVIITGISIGRGTLHLPRKQKREIRKEAHFLRAKGIISESKYEKTYDPFHYDRVMGRLSFWQQVEPENPYPIKMISELKRMAMGT